MNPEELEDAELDQAMSELNIEKQTVTPEDLEQGDDPTAAEPTAAPGGASSDYIAELEQLASLRDARILTDEEFEANRRQILGLYEPVEQYMSPISTTIHHHSLWPRLRHSATGSVETLPFATGTPDRRSEQRHCSTGS